MLLDQARTLLIIKPFSNISLLTFPRIIYTFFAFYYVHYTPRSLLILFILFLQLSQLLIADWWNRNVSKLILTENIPRVHVNTQGNGTDHEKAHKVLPEEWLSDSVQRWSHLEGLGVSVSVVALSESLVDANICWKM